MVQQNNEAWEHLGFLLSEPMEMYFITTIILQLSFLLLLLLFNKDLLVIASLKNKNKF